MKNLEPATTTQGPVERVVFGVLTWKGEKLDYSKTTEKGTKNRFHNLVFLVQKNLVLVKGVFGRLSFLAGLFAPLSPAGKYKLLNRHHGGALGHGRLTRE